MVGGVLWINNVAFVISAVSSQNNTAITLATTAGTQTGVTYYFWGASTSIGGLVGAFTDSSGNIVKTLDWSSFKGINPAGAFTLTSVAVSGQFAQYNGTITNGGSNLFAGYFFTITGFTNALNNGMFLCTSNSTASVTVVNTNAIAETHAGSAQQLSWVGFRVPSNAAFLSLGNNDTVLSDNTGSHAITAVQLDTTMWSGSSDPFLKGPFGGCPISPAFMPDAQPNLKTTVAISCVALWLHSTNPFAKYFSGQLYPQGKN
jgi:hypothetical protein